MPRVDCLPGETKRLLEAVSSIPEIGRFTLIGGTALVDDGPTDLDSLKAAISRHLDRYEEALAAEILAEERDDDRDDPTGDATP